MATGMAYENEVLQVAGTISKAGSGSTVEVYTSVQENFSGASTPTLIGNLFFCSKRSRVSTMNGRKYEVTLLVSPLMDTGELLADFLELMESPSTMIKFDRYQSGIGTEILGTDLEVITIHDTPLYAVYKVVI